MSHTDESTKGCHTLRGEEEAVRRTGRNATHSHARETDYAEGSEVGKELEGREGQILQVLLDPRLGLVLVAPIGLPSDSGAPLLQKRVVVAALLKTDRKLIVTTPVEVDGRPRTSAMEIFPVLLSSGLLPVVGLTV